MGSIAVLLCVDTLIGKIPSLTFPTVLPAPEEHSTLT